MAPNILSRYQFTPNQPLKAEFHTIVQILLNQHFRNECCKGKDEVRNQKLLCPNSNVLRRSSVTQDRQIPTDHNEERHMEGIDKISQLIQHYRDGNIKRIAMSQHNKQDPNNSCRGYPRLPRSLHRIHSEICSNRSKSDWSKCQSSASALPRICAGRLMPHSTTLPGR